MKVISVNNQQSQKYPLLFQSCNISNVVFSGIVRTNRGINNTVAAERRKAGDFAASIAFRFINKDLGYNQDMLRELSKLGENADVFQISVKGSDSGFTQPFELFVNHVSAFKDGKLSEVFAKFFDRIKGILSTIRKSQHVNIALRTPDEKQMRAFLSSDASIKFESAEFDKGIKDINGAANTIYCALERVSDILKVSNPKPKKG